MSRPRVAPRDPRAVLLANRYCGPLRLMYEELTASPATSWDQVEGDFLAAMSAFDSGLPQEVEGDDEAKRELSAALQNGKGDWFNNVLAHLLEQCSGIETLYVRRKVPGLIVPEHNLDGVYPGEPDREIEFLLEAKMMGTPRHGNSKAGKPFGRPGSADTGKRVKELAFKSIDLKGEAARRLTMVGQAPTAGGAGGGDLSTWLHASRPKIFFFLAARVVSDTDFAAMVRWAETASEVVDAVGLYCYEPVGDGFTTYGARQGVPTKYELGRVLFRACTELQRLRTAPPPPIPSDVAPGPAALADDLTDQAEPD